VLDAHFSGPNLRADACTETALEDMALDGAERERNEGRREKVGAKLVESPMKHARAHETHKKF